MPSPLKGIDWGLIQALYLKGAQPDELAQQFGIKVGTIYQRASRLGWALEKTKAQAITAQAQVSAVIQEASEPDIDLIGRRVRRSLARVIEQTTSTLERERPSDAKGKAARLSAIEKLSATGKTIFGWGSDNVKVSLNLSLLGHATTAQLLQPIDIKHDTKDVSHNINYLQLAPPSTGQVVDIEPVTTESEPDSEAK